MSAATDDDRGLFTALVGDGRPLLSLTGLLLIGFGQFALFLSATGQFLPHDVAFLGTTPDKRRDVNEGRVVHFMFHDRVSFGGDLTVFSGVRPSQDPAKPTPAPRRGFDAKIFTISKNKGIAGGCLKASDVLPDNGRIFFAAS